MFIDYVVVGVMVIALAGVVLSLLLGLVKRSRRFARRSGFVAGALLIASLAVMGVRLQGLAREAGFDSLSDQQNAKRAGIASAEIWHQQRAALLAKWGAEEEAQKALLAAEDAAKEATARAAERTQEQRCLESDDCLQKKFLVDAIRKCKPVIEAYAKYDYDWIGIPSFFAAYVDRQEGTIRYSGNDLKLQNGFGVWQRYRYECLYSFNRGQLVNAIVNER